MIGAKKERPLSPKHHFSPNCVRAMPPSAGPIPRAWPGFEIDFRYHSARYEIVVQNPHGVSRGVVSWELDGKAQPGAAPAHVGGSEAARPDGAPAAPLGATIPLVDDGATHRIRVVLGPAAVAEAEAAAPPASTFLDPVPSPEA